MIEASDFQRLVEAYGADRRHWPDDRRPVAEAFLAAFPEQAAGILAADLSLDEALDVLRPPAPSAALQDRILAMSPRPRLQGLGGMFDWLRPGVGAMMAASCVAGVLAGVVLVAPPERSDPGAGDVVAALTGPGDAVVLDDDSEVS
jgi:hypothetical protein